MSKVTWGDPPERPRKGGRNPRRYLYQEEAAEFRAHPGRWGQVEVHQAGPRAATSLADNIRRGREAVFRPVGHWEAKASEGKVWVRYTGNGTAIGGNGSPVPGKNALFPAGGSYPDAGHVPGQDGQQDGLCHCHEPAHKPGGCHACTQPSPGPLAATLNETERRWHLEGWPGKVASHG